MKRLGALLVASGVLASVITGTAGAQERAAEDEQGEVEMLVREPADPTSYVPLPWELPGLTFPVLDHDAAVAASSADNAQLVFIDGNELGAFRPAPAGGSPFFGSGQPIFGLAAPPVLPSRILHPLGDGDAGDRFLGARPPVDPSTVIPKLGETFDRSRESFAFIGGIPPIVDGGPGGSAAFPLAEVLEADPTPGCLDNDPTCVPQPPTTVPEPPGTPPTTFAPGPRPPDQPPDLPPGPPVTAPTTTPTTAPRPTTPTTAPPTGTTSTTSPTTTLPVTTTTSPTTTTVPTTTTTTVPTTTTTTTTTVPVPPQPPPPAPTVGFVLANRVADDVDHSSADLCLSNGTGSNANANCDELFRFGDPAAGRAGFMELGQEYAVNLTLWNIPNQSEEDAVSLEGYAPSGCTSTPTSAASNDSLCRAIQLKIERFSTSTRGTRVQCVYGSGPGCDFDPSKTLWSFGRDHTSANGVELADPDGFPLGRKSYLRITVRIEDSGLRNDGSGIGADNHLIGQKADLTFRWLMTSA